MNDMTPDAQLALRRPFPPESVGQLPKGGALLDFVGHAAVTDRLLTVDPNWTWEPFALGPEGLPAVQGGNLWIRLTVCGVTRIGVGDGKNAKECIGDAIRNAAMRFGVALDLWAKENLVEFAQAAQTHLVPPMPYNGPPPAFADDLEAGLAAQVAAPMTPAHRAGMFAEFTRVGITDRDMQLAGINRITGQAYTSRGDLTDVHARAVIADLKKRPAMEQSKHAEATS